MGDDDIRALATDAFARFNEGESTSIAERDVTPVSPL